VPIRNAVPRVPVAPTVAPVAAVPALPQPWATNSTDGAATSSIALGLSGSVAPCADTAAKATPLTSATITARISAAIRGVKRTVSEVDPERGTAGAAF